jgi:hypothetical protein
LLPSQQTWMVSKLGAENILPPQTYLPRSSHHRDLLSLNPTQTPDWFYLQSSCRPVSKDK